MTLRENNFLIKSLECCYNALIISRMLVDVNK